MREVGIDEAVTGLVVGMSGNRLGFVQHIVDDGDYRVFTIVRIDRTTGRLTDDTRDFRVARTDHPLTVIDHRKES